MDINDYFYTNGTLFPSNFNDQFEHISEMYRYSIQLVSSTDHIETLWIIAVRIKVSTVHDDRSYNNDHEVFLYITLKLITYITFCPRKNVENTFGFLKITLKK